MKESEILPIVVNLGPCFFGEYRGSLVERVDFVDKKDGKASSFIKCMHLFEYGPGGAVQSIRVFQRIPNTIMEPSLVQVPFERGKRYLLQLQTVAIEKGNVSGSMDLGFEPIQVG